MLANEKRRRRRESHNAVERRRRDNINEKISELATLIPECLLDPASGAGAARKEGEENEEDVEGIKQQLRFTKQESVNSTRNALRLAREAEETARNTLGKLGDQSGWHLAYALPPDCLSAFSLFRETRKH